MSFEDWLAQVDRWLVRKVGLAHADLPDQATRSYYDQGITPSEAGRMIVGEVCEEMGMDVEDLLGDED